MSPRSPARMRRNLDTMSAKPSSWGAIDYASCDALPALTENRRSGPVASAQKSQYAASPIHYGQPFAIPPSAYALGSPWIDKATS